MIESPNCEAKIDGAWRTLSLVEVHRRYRDASKRCPACHGRVRIYCHYLRAHRPIMRHDEPHNGCPLIAATYRGTLSPHPRAIG
ncbi:hypothetical protein FV241_09820 [Methylobacterium sp. WL2]|nr:hypothetical protein FVA80_22505 [Methylobacterium sp. WL1]TXN57747.1 hypothetical protein FV241_09820 [Methylobacterium sp. WL2]